MPCFKLLQAGIQYPPGQPGMHLGRAPDV